MKNNQSSGRINKLFSQGRFILKNLLYISTFLVTTNLPAAAVSFNFSYQSGSITKKQIEGVELAGNIWSSYLQDSNVEVNSHLAPENLDVKSTTTCKKS
ncbi:MAG: hypothetical protein MJK14_01225 [Rivularia sp. ALOHA_DT_140]|nr:hypothetical protein [Rivularia sp. ALOHA_DT_140]